MLDLSAINQNLHLIILVGYAYVLLFHVKDSDYTKMIILTLLTMLAICYIKKGPVIQGYGYGYEYFTNKKGGKKNKRVRKSGKEGFTGSPELEGDATLVDPAQVAVAEAAIDPPLKQPTAQVVLPGNMSVFDGVCLQTGNTEHWMKSPAQTSLVDNDSLFTYLTSQGPLKPVFSDHSQLIGPPIDGQEGSPGKMFMFANNRSSPNCCPSTFSTSTGCVCTTKGQRDFVNNRGHNNPKANNNGEF